MALTLFVFAVLLGIGTPLGFAIAGTAFANFLTTSQSLFRLLPQRLFTGIDSFTLLAIPFFILAGGLMNEAGVTPRLLKLSNCLVGGLRGGLALANIVISMFFGGITGAATADTAAIGSVLIPGMVKEGYDVDFSAAVTAASSCLGPIIPPSIIMVTYGVIMGTSIGGLFIAGIVPGILLGLFLMVPAYAISLKRQYPKGNWPSWGYIWDTFKDAWWALLTPVIILGGILSGLFTPTEASAIAVFYAMFVGFFVYKELKISVIPRCLSNAIIITSSILFLLGVANIFSWILAAQEIPAFFMNLFLSITDNVYVLLLLLNILLLVIGMFIEPGAAVILFAPIVVPMFLQLGVHPLHIGLIVILNLIIGLITPPVGLCLAIACSLTGRPLDAVGKAMLPFMAAAIFVLLLVTYVPATVLFIPRLLGYS